MKPVIVALFGLLFLIIGIWFYGLASNLNQLGPIKFGMDVTDSNGPVAVAVASGFKAYVADKLTLIGEILIIVGAVTWIWTPSRISIR
jgi:hypothetical protein